MSIEQTIVRGLAVTSAGYVHYRAAGSGPLLLLLHINQQSSALYLELIAALAPAFRVIAPDYPGYGMSDPVDTAPAIADYARWMVELMDALGMDTATVLGEAVGAVIAVELARVYPQRIGRAILVNCPYYPDLATADRNHAPLKSGLRPGDASGFPVTRTLEFVREHDATHAPMQPTQSWMDRINAAQIAAGRNRWQALDALHDYPLAAALRDFTQPALLLMGEHFHYVKHLPDFQASVHNLQTGVVAGARFCMTWERADEIARRVTTFLHPE